jgi:hypothetical protein
LALLLRLRSHGSLGLRLSLLPNPLNL